MKTHLLLLLSILTLEAFGQKNATPTNALKITGKVKSERTFTLADLDTFPQKSIGDIVVTNHLGEIKKTVKNASGVLVKKLLEKVELQTDNPKALSAVYFVFLASDGYAVIFSWNEIFNTETGNNLYVITQKDGKKMDGQDDRILAACTSDFKTGRRYIKGLEKIMVAGY
jgi:hypothetical protein